MHLIVHMSESRCTFFWGGIPCPKPHSAMQWGETLNILKPLNTILNLQRFYCVISLIITVYKSREYGFFTQQLLSRLLLVLIFPEDPHRWLSCLSSENAPKEQTKSKEQTPNHWWMLFGFPFQADWTSGFALVKQKTFAKPLFIVFMFSGPGVWEEHARQIRQGQLGFLEWFRKCCPLQVSKSIEVIFSRC